MLIELQVIGVVALAMILGGIIGLDREFADKPAGWRTHILVSGASALFVRLGTLIVANQDLSQQVINTDPVRIIEAILTGITFLGAGTIIRQKMEVEGLTTAASLLFVSGVGVAVALSQFVVAIGATLLIVLTLRGLKMLERLVADRQSQSEAESN